MRFATYRLDLVLIVVAVVVVLTHVQVNRARVLTPAQHCGFSPATFDPPFTQPATGTLTQTTLASSTTISLELWVPAMRQYCWRAFLPWLAARQLSQPQVALTVHPMEMNDAPFYEQFADAAQRGQAPAISFVRNVGLLVDWAEAGYLTPVDECSADDTPIAARFASVRTELWQTAQWQGKTWGVPIEINTAPLFFNRAKLQALGWSQTEIDNLPDRIQRGDFTLADLMATGRQAVEQGSSKQAMPFGTPPAQDGERQSHKR